MGRLAVISSRRIGPCNPIDRYRQQRQTDDRDDRARDHRWEEPQHLAEEIADDDLSVSPITEWPETPESIYEKKEFSSFIKEAIDKLPEKYKTVFILKDIEEFTNQEIADILGISLPAVKSRLLRARLKVRELLASYGKEALS